MKYRTAIANADGWTDWQYPTKLYKFMCCDCNLVHDIEFDRYVNFRVRRNNRATAASRRQRPPRLVGGSSTFHKGYMKPREV